MGVVPIAWKNRYKKSISSNPSIITVNSPFSDDTTFDASNQAVFRRLGPF